MIKYFIAAIVLCLSSMTVQARTINVNVNNTKADVTQMLREQCHRATWGDTVVINFGKGTYTVDGTVECNTHLIIKGKGRDKTTVVLNKGSNRSGFKAFLDDTFFKIAGTLRRPVTLSISDITFKLKDHNGIWWKGERCFAVKVYHANRVNIHNVDSYLQNAICTNYDLHVCSNVSITNCIISNYNNTTDGGNLWLRGEMHNISIKDNKFFKYGKDEAVAIYDRVVDNTNGYIRGKADRSDIFIENNEFHYGYNDKDKDYESVNHMIVSLFTDHSKSTDCCSTRNFHLSGNKFYINDKCTRCIYVSFDPADSHKDIYIENNEIVNANLNSGDRYYRQDIEVNDLSSNPSTIYINGNTVRNKNIVLTSSDSQGYSFLLMQGGNVTMTGNKIINDATIIPSTGKSTGIQLIWAGADGGEVTMRDNVCKGIKYIATVGAGDGTEQFTLNASNNYFEGDTRVYSHKVKRLDVNFTGNTLVSENMNFFLQEFAPRGSVVFNNNDVTVKQGEGQLMTHWSNSSTKSMRFDRLEVTNNTLRGVNGEQDLLKNMTNVGKRTIQRNTISGK